MLDEIMKEIQKFKEKTIIQFLNENGYKVPETITKDFLEDLKNKLVEEDKFVDILEDYDYNIKKNYAKQYMIPFFNSISNPLSEESKQFIIEKWREKRNIDGRTNK